MKKFKECYSSLIEQLGNNFNLSQVLDFITYFRCDDVNLYNEFLKNYDEVGYYSSRKLIELYCKYNNIELNDKNSKDIFLGIVDNLWNKGMSYHLTTSVSALNIMDYGMNPSKKEADVVKDISSLIALLSEDGKRKFFPFARNDIDTYSYASIPKLNVNYGKAPEWYLNIIGYSNDSFEKIVPNIMKEMVDESSEAKEKMLFIVSKYYELYKNSSRVLVVIPGLNKNVSEEIINIFDVNNVDNLINGVRYFIGSRSRNIDAKSNKVVSSDDLMFIDVKTKNIVNFEERDKKI